MYQAQETPVVAQRIEAWPQQDTRIKSNVTFFKPIHGLVRISERCLDHGNLWARFATHVGLPQQSWTAFCSSSIASLYMCFPRYAWRVDYGREQNWCPFRSSCGSDVWPHHRSARTKSSAKSALVMREGTSNDSCTSGVTAELLDLYIVLITRPPCSSAVATLQRLETVDAGRTDALVDCRAHGMWTYYEAWYVTPFE